ncbi:MAG: hypothetical protein R3324_18530, partial [Halobacteriales archaeon]|nr:hypothetical protein [Halobacteriales archaeon]
MPAYRFRVKLAADPTALWRDIVIGGDRPLTAFQATINEAVGLNQEHLWFFGIDEDYWESSVTYMHPEEYEGFPSGGPMGREETVYNAAETTVADVVTQLDLDERDRICYLFDYGSEWRFYAILKAVMEDEPSEIPSEVTREKGE